MQHTECRAAGFAAACLFLAACLAAPAAAGFQWVEATIADVQSAIKSKDATCAAVMAGYLERIRVYDQPSGLNAVIFTNPNAMEEARAIDVRIVAGEPIGPLFCIPVLLKDNFDTADMPTSGGSIALKNSIPPDDAFMVKKLREADAIIIAKTNMAEWAFSPRQTVSSSYGVTANAYDLQRVPAGSSGGTASATAASFGVIGMGSDTGNSIRGPASHLALFGIRSTLGLTSRDGVIPLAFDRDIAGPLTRTVTDGAKAFNVLAGFDPADPYTAAGKGRREADYTVFLDRGALRGKRIGVLRALVDTAEADPQVTALFEQALINLRKAGAEIVDPFSIANLDAHIEADYFCARFRYDMREYLGTLGADAPIRDVMEVRQTGQYSPYIEDGLAYFGSNPADRHPRDLDPPCPDYEEHEGRQAFLADTLASMDAAKVDAMVYPSWTNPPAHLDTAEEEYKGDNSQLIAPATGMPAVSVPMGFTYGGLPAGLQVLGRPYSEGLLFGLAFAYEQATMHRRAPAAFAELEHEGGADVAQHYPHAAEPIGTVRQVYDGALYPDLQVNTFRNIGRLFPTRTVEAGSKAYPLPPGERVLQNFSFASRGKQYDLYDFLSLNRVSGILVVKDGGIVFEKYLLGNGPETKWMSMSVVKSITATLVGMAIHDGLIEGIDDPLIRYLPQFAGTAYDGVSVRNLLQMTSGVDWNETYTAPASDRRAMLEAQISQQPGEILSLMARLERAADPGNRWNYSTGETQVVGALVHAATGMPVTDYLAKKIWRPFGMESDATWWLESPNGLEIGGSGLSATLRDYARFGMFMLNGGIVDGRQTLPDGWIAEATTPKNVSGERVDYGYMWWPLDQGAYAAIGIFGQFVYVHPDAKLVVAMWSAQPKPVGMDTVDEYDFFNALATALE